MDPNKARVLAEIQDEPKKISEIADTLGMAHERVRETMHELSRENRVVSTPGFSYEPAN